ncbi:hypothetical protein OE749_16760 [Aestuariibacter sp. AA17]|uniref:Bacteriocin n=1 Tax=Fluctibacter corallii TaxID=2984329 RepID=A0ABT3ACI5_9ALTE|nr:hypothetical protein [Aestuariibacter sp. AA17]MCV2886348.1 hypothetical protein [Aestuariibacter sp. AA17]
MLVETSMAKLNDHELCTVSGGVGWNAVSAGATMVAIGVAVAATPVGWVGAAGATLVTFAGGYSIGSGVRRDVESYINKRFGG